MANQVALGWNNAGSLADFTRDPRVEFINYGRERVAGDGFTYEDGKLSCDLMFDILSETQKAAIDTALGVSASVASAKITLAVEDNDDRAATNYNAFSSRMRGRHDRGYWVNCVYPIYGMVEI